jgi:hypothetical protein
MRKRQAHDEFTQRVRDSRLHIANEVYCIELEELSQWRQHFPSFPGLSDFLSSPEYCVRQFRWMNETLRRLQPAVPEKLAQDILRFVSSLPTRNYDVSLVTQTSCELLAPLISDFEVLPRTATSKEFAILHIPIHRASAVLRPNERLIRQISSNFHSLVKYLTEESELAHLFPTTLWNIICRDFLQWY